MREWKGYQRGINLGGWFSQCDYSEDRFENYIKEEDIKRIASWGVDHVRVPIDYNLVQEDDGNYIEKGFGYIQRIIDWCGKYKLNMILDVHKTYGYSFDKGENEYGFFDSPEYQERFYCLWEELARRYGQYCDRVAFELLNEVTKPEYNEIWNKVANTCTKRIRAIVPDCYILIGGYHNNSITSIPYLDPPMDDHIIYNFHCYDPLVFTHQGGYWVENMILDYRVPFDVSMNKLLEDTRNMLGDSFGEYPDVEDMDKPLDARFFRALFAEAIKISEERDVPLYCGEYGVIDLASPEDTLKWYKAINEVFEENGIGRAAWNYKEMDFGLTDERLKDVFDELKEYF